MCREKLCPRNAFAEQIAELPTRSAARGKAAAGTSRRWSATGWVTEDGREATPGILASSGVLSLSRGRRGALLWSNRSLDKIDSPAPEGIPSLLPGPHPNEDGGSGLQSAAERSLSSYIRRQAQRLVFSSVFKDAPQTAYSGCPKAPLNLS
jgi:hypothetical protein